MIVKHFDTDRINAVPLNQVAEWLGEKVKKYGTHYKTRCPWHDDKNPSLAIYVDDKQNHCYCFSCRSEGNVVNYVMEHEHVDFKSACEMLSNHYGIPMINFDTETNEPVGIQLNNKHLKQEKKMDKVMNKPRYSYIPQEYLQKHLSVENSLCKAMFKLYDAERVKYVADLYQLGCFENSSYSDGTMFPSIDREGRIHNIKVQNYNYDISSPDFGHYKKGEVLWLGSILSKNGYEGIPSNATFDNNCLFGAHLLKDEANRKVALVESPKNAVVGAAEFPQYTWVAAGSKGMLKADALECLRDKDVLVIPDRDAIAEWTTTLSTMKHIANFRISDICEKIAPDGKLKYDIADYFLDKRIEGFVF